MSNNIKTNYPDIDVHSEAYEQMKIELLLSINKSNNISFYDLNQKYGGQNMQKGMSDLEAMGYFVKGRVAYLLTLDGILHLTMFGEGLPLTAKALDKIQPYITTNN